MGVIVAEGLTKKFHGTAALDALDLSVEAGEIVGYLGPNGAGKTTTLRLMLGLLRPTAGKATILGHPAGSDEARRETSCVLGDVNLWPQLTGAEAMELLGSLHGEVDRTYRDELIEAFELDPSRMIRAYSKGNRQKVVLVAALATRSRALLLDEPTSGLDPLMERVFREQLRRARDDGRAVLFSSHMLSEVEQLSTRVAMIRAGRLVTVADVEDLRARAGSVYEVTGDVGDLKDIEGVLGVDVSDGVTLVHVQGSPAPLLGVLATRGVESLKTHESTLEEIFLSYYEAS